MQIALGPYFSTRELVLENELTLQEKDLFIMCLYELKSHLDRFPTDLQQMGRFVEDMAMKTIPPIATSKAEQIAKNLLNPRAYH